MPKQERVAIVTDSTCDLPEELRQQYDIRVLPLRILYSDREYRDQVDITAEEVYASLDKEVPSTSLPSPEEVIDLFNRLKKEGFTHVLSIHLSFGLSGTGQMIQNLAKQVQGIVIEVVDSKSISMGLGYTVLEAARAVQKNQSFESILSHVQNIMTRMKVFFVLNTLEYLKRGGRIGKVAGTLGQILNVKPIITVNDEGIYTTYTKARGRKQSIEKMFAIIKEHLAKPFHNVAICHGGAQKEAQEFMERVKALGNINELITGSVSPVIGVHTGPGTLGFVVYNTESAQN